MLCIAKQTENWLLLHIFFKVYASPEVNLEPIFTAKPQEEEHGFSSLQLPPIAIDHAPYFPGSTFPDAYYGNKYSIMVEFPFVSSYEEEDNVDFSFSNSILADEDIFISEKASQTPTAFINDSTASQSLRVVHFESSETDAELLCTDNDIENFLQIPSSLWVVFL